jgi:hypothetical protein
LAHHTYFWPSDLASPPTTFRALKHLTYVIEQVLCAGKKLLPVPLRENTFVAVSVNLKRAGEPILAPPTRRSRHALVSAPDTPWRQSATDTFGRFSAALKVVTSHPGPAYAHGRRPVCVYKCTAHAYRLLTKLSFSFFFLSPSPSLSTVSSLNNARLCRPHTPFCARCHRCPGREACYLLHGHYLQPGRHCRFRLHSHHHQQPRCPCRLDAW